MSTSLLQLPPRLCATCLNCCTIVSSIGGCTVQRLLFCHRAAASKNPLSACGSSESAPPTVSRARSLALVDLVHFGGWRYPGRPFYFATEVALALFVIVLCTLSIDWTVVEPKDRTNAIMVSLLTVVALKVRIHYVYTASARPVWQYAHRQICAYTHLSVIPLLLTHG